MEYLTKNHSKYLLQYHIIFVVKYRLKIIDQFCGFNLLYKIL